jgi:hypothetical protein
MLAHYLDVNDYVIQFTRITPAIYAYSMVIEEAARGYFAGTARLW